MARRRWMKKAARATSETMVQPPTVPPMMGPRDCFFAPPLLPLLVSEVVGDVIGDSVTVTVRTADGADDAPKLRSAVDVKPWAVHPCWVMVPLSYSNSHL